MVNPLHMLDAMLEPLTSRPTASFTIFFRTISGEGGYLCHACGSSCADRFSRLGHAFAVANQHLSLCRAAVRHRPLEGSAVIDGKKHTVVLRDGMMVVALDSVFGAAPSPMRVIA
jgi:hypothetical protein